MKWLTDKIEFPNVNTASSEGIVALGGDLSVERLLLAYKSAIFPWYNEDEPIIWWSPNPRFVLFPKALKISKSMQQFIRNTNLTFTTNQAFETVIQNCAKVKRKNQTDTWITTQMIESYIKLHELGYALSVEVWNHQKLVAGLYGVDLKNGVFCGESMFTTISNASKFAFIKWIQNSNYKLIDCQVHTKHLESLGAAFIERDKYLQFLK